MSILPLLIRAWHAATVRPRTHCPTALSSSVEELFPIRTVTRFMEIVLASTAVPMNAITELSSVPQLIELRARRLYRG